MRFPVIRIRDIDRNYTKSIVGENIHDLLYVDEKTGGIHYLNQQCFSSTQEDEEGYEFVPSEIEEGIQRIEMVSFKTLSEIYFQDSDKEIKEIMKKAFEDIEKIEDQNREYFQENSKDVTYMRQMDFKSKKNIDITIKLTEYFEAIGKEEE